jgi:hypothetical protein
VSFFDLKLQNFTDDKCVFSLSGLSPFMGDNDAETFANTTRADFDFEDEAFDAISQDAKDFISALLVQRKEYVVLGLAY